MRKTPDLSFLERPLEDFERENGDGDDFEGGPDFGENNSAGPSEPGMPDFDHMSPEAALADAQAMTPAPLPPQRDMSDRALAKRMVLRSYAKIWPDDLVDIIDQLDHESLAEKQFDELEMLHRRCEMMCGIHSAAESKKQGFFALVNLVETYLVGSGFEITGLTVDLAMDKDFTDNVLRAVLRFVNEKDGNPIFSVGMSVIFKAMKYLQLNFDKRQAQQKAAAIAMALMETPIDAAFDDLDVEPDVGGDKSMAAELPDNIIQPMPNKSTRRPVS